MGVAARRSMLTQSLGPPGDMGVPDLTNQGQWASYFGLMILYNGSAPADVTTTMRTFYFDGRSEAGTGSVTFFACTVSGGTYTVQAVGPTVSIANPGGLYTVSGGMAVQSGWLLGLHAASSRFDPKYKTSGISENTQFWQANQTAPAVGGTYSSGTASSSRAVFRATNP